MLTAQASQDVEKQRDVMGGQRLVLQKQLKAVQKEEAEAYMVRCCAMVSR